MLELVSLPARQGDSLWIRWGDAEDPYQLLIDMGTIQTGKAIRQQLADLDESKRKFELLVVTHVDSDHIGGIISCLVDADPLPGLEFKDVWFNGYHHLKGKSIKSNDGVRALGPVQGEKFGYWLRTQSWNVAFDGGPACRRPGEELSTVELAGGLKLTVLGPTPARLKELIPAWEAEVFRAIEKGALDPDEVSAGVRELGRVQKEPKFESGSDMEFLADGDFREDESEANGSSIVILLEYEGRKLLLTGDAFAEDLIEGIEHYAGDDRPHFDVFKVPHHGSQNNLSKRLVKAVDCDYWLISTDGTQHKHPDPAAVARIICYSTSENPRIGFNVPSEYSNWWSNEEWKTMRSYDAEFGDADSGITLTFPS